MTVTTLAADAPAINGNPACDRWTEALTQYRETTAAIECAWEPFKDKSVPIPDPVSDKLERLAGLNADARGALLNTPAPDAAALLVKLELLLEIEPGHESIAAWSRHMVEPAMADARRLLSDHGRALWNERLAEYHRQTALETADRKFGFYGQACEADDRAKANFRQGRGVRWSGHVPKHEDPLWCEALEAWEQCQAAEHSRERLILPPFWASIRALILTPAPDADALRFKVDLIDQEGFDGDPGLPDDLWAFIREEAARLAPSGAKTETN